MYLITVVPLSKSARTDVLSYFYSSEIPLGTLVEVPFRSKHLKAIVTETKPIEDMKGAIKTASFQLKKVSRVLAGNTENPFSPELFAACKSLADIYLAPVSKIIDDVIPEVLFEERKKTGARFARARITVPPGFLCESLPNRISWYKTRIRELFAQKKSIYIVLPTEQETEKMFSLLSRGIEEYSVLLTSGIGKKKMTAALKKIHTEEHPLCIFGTATYLSIPREDLDTIVLEHENSGSYRRVVQPCIDMRIFVELYAKEKKISLIFADTLPRLETYNRYKNGEIDDVFHFGFHPELPDKEFLIARAHDGVRGSWSMLSDELQTLIEQTITAGSRIYLFALRNGLASITACRDCGEVLTCEYCEAPLALFKTTGDKRLFICNTCKRHTPAESSCKRCGSWNLFPYGIGVESLYDECLKKFPGGTIMRLDRGSVANDKQARDVAKAWSETPGAILVGTELAMHYLPEKIPTTAIVSFDSLFSIPSFRVPERIVELATALRERTAKTLLIQTMYPDDKLLKVTSKPKLIAWYEEELVERQEFNYPPFKTLIKLTGHFTKDALSGERSALAQALAPFSPDIYTTPSPENRDFIRLIALIRVSPKEWSPATLTKGATFNPALKEMLQKLKEHYLIAINPEDLL